MIPPNILQAATEKKLDVIGITDHNSAENVAAMREAAETTGIRVVGGMEVTSAEEVHLLALFDGDEELAGFQQLVYDNLHGTNDTEAFGYQWVVDAEGGVIDVNPRLLIGATVLSVHEVVDGIHGFGGVAIAAHVDRQSFSIIGQLGFIPEDLDLDAVELSPFSRENGFGPDELAAGVAGDRKLVAVRFSDAHHVDEIGRAATELIVADGSVAELRLALRGEGGRAVVGGV